MRIQPSTRWTKPFAMVAICLILTSQYVWAQNLGTAPAINTAVQGQTGAQPEGAFLNFINWIGNVIAPVAAGGAVVGGRRELDHWSRRRSLADCGDGVLGSVWRHATPGVLGHERNWRCHVKSKADAESSRSERQAVWNVNPFNPGCLS